MTQGQEVLLGNMELLQGIFISRLLSPQRLPVEQDTMHGVQMELVLQQRLQCYNKAYLIPVYSWTLRRMP